MAVTVLNLSNEQATHSARSVALREMCEDYRSARWLVWTWVQVRARRHAAAQSSVGHRMESADELSNSFPHAEKLMEVRTRYPRLCEDMKSRLAISKPVWSSASSVTYSTYLRHASSVALVPPDDSLGHSQANYSRRLHRERHHEGSRRALAVWMFALRAAASSSLLCSIVARAFQLAALFSKRMRWFAVITVVEVNKSASARRRQPAAVSWGALIVRAVGRCGIAIMPWRPVRDVRRPQPPWRYNGQRARNEWAALPRCWQLGHLRATCACVRANMHSPW